MSSNFSKPLMLAMIPAELFPVAQAQRFHTLPLLDNIRNLAFKYHREKIMKTRTN